LKKDKKEEEETEKVRYLKNIYLLVCLLFFEVKSKFLERKKKTHQK